MAWEPLGVGNGGEVGATGFSDGASALVTPSDVWELAPGSCGGMLAPRASASASGNGSGGVNGQASSWDPLGGTLAGVGVDVGGGVPTLAA